MTEGTPPETGRETLDGRGGSPRFRRLIPAGLLDVGSNSLATFISGYYAATELTPAALGVYAIVAAAFKMASVVPRDLIYMPAEVVALDYDPRTRLRMMRQTMPLSSLPMVGAVIPIALAALIAGSVMPLDLLIGMSVGAAAASILAPVQDHARRLLHLAGLSWSSVLVSVSKMVALIIALVIMVSAGVAPEWIPFGSLAVGNAAASAIGLAMAARLGSDEPVRKLRLGTLVSSGRWLLAVGLLPTGAGFLAVSIVVWLAGAEAAGFAEAARIMAQPVIVFATGLSAVTSPRSMEAASQRRERYARKVSRLFNGMIVGGSLIYGLVVGFEWSWSPLPAALPNAYEVKWLLLLTLLAHTLNSIAFPFRSELIAARQEVMLASNEAIGNGMRVAVAATAGATGAYAIPLSFSVLGIYRWAGYRIRLDRFYEQPSKAQLPRSEPESPPPVARA